MDIPPKLNDSLVLAKSFLPLAVIAIIGTFADATTIGGGPLATNIAIMDKHQSMASAKNSSQGSVISTAAADQNVVHTAEEASGNDKSDN